MHALRFMSHLFVSMLEVHVLQAVGMLLLQQCWDSTTRADRCPGLAKMPTDVALCQQCQTGIPSPWLAMLSRSKTGTYSSNPLPRQHPSLVRGLWFDFLLPLDLRAPKQHPPLHHPYYGNFQRCEGSWSCWCLSFQLCWFHSRRLYPPFLIYVDDTHSPKSWTNITMVSTIFFRSQVLVHRDPLETPGPTAQRPPAALSEAWTSCCSKTWTEPSQVKPADHGADNSGSCDVKFHHFKGKYIDR